MKISRVVTFHNRSVSARYDHCPQQNERFLTNTSIYRNDTQWQPRTGIDSRNCMGTLVCQINAAVANSMTEHERNRINAYFACFIFINALVMYWFLTKALWWFFSVGQAFQRMIALKLDSCVTFDVTGCLFGCKSSCISDANFATT